MQKTYWIKMTQYKFSILYLQNYMGRNIKIDRLLKIMVAVMSAGSIAAWANWQNLSMLWGFIIALAQVISAINEFLPYKNRTKEISNLLGEFTYLYNEVEKNWKNVADGSMEEEDINNLCYDFSKKWLEIDNKYFQEDHLPQNSNCIKKAEIEKNEYFKNMFGGE